MNQTRALNIIAAIGIALTTTMIVLMMGNNPSNLGCVLTAISIIELFALSTACKKHGYRNLTVGLFLLAIYITQNAWVRILEYRVGATSYLSTSELLITQNFWRSSEVSLVFNILLTVSVCCLFLGLSRLVKFGRRKSATS